MSEARKEYTIPTFSYLIKFVSKQYGQRSPIQVDENTAMGKFITLSLLDRRPWKEYASFNTPERSDKLSASLKIILTKEQSEMAVRKSKLLRINTDLDRLFKEHMITFIEALRTNGIPASHACKQFLRYFHIEETEYSFDAAYKHYKRQKVKRVHARIAAAA
jgi:hypothetical protein